MKRDYGPGEGPMRGVVVAVAVSGLAVVFCVLLGKLAGGWS